MEAYRALQKLLWRQHPTRSAVALGFPVFLPTVFQLLAGACLRAAWVASNLIGRALGREGVLFWV